MSALRQLQDSFLGHLLGKPSDLVNQIESTADTSAQQRIDIYASGYRLRLKEALETDFEQLHAYLGDEQFNQLMDVYIDRHQSHHTSLRYYSQYMLSLLSECSPYSEMPVLFELAQIEQSFNHSFDAADCDCIGTDELAQLAPEAWPEIKLQFHDSVQLISCDYNSFQIWKALSEETTPPELKHEVTTWVIWRKDLVSRYRALSDEEASIFKLGILHNDFSSMCESLIEHFEAHEIPQQAVGFLQTWINEKMVCALSV
jgi:hypothetical protein